MGWDLKSVQLNQRSRSSAGERLLHTQDVTGSIPVATTTPRSKGSLPATARKSSVYVIEREARVVKIGRSADPVRRRSELQTASADHLTLVHHWRLTNSQAVAFESQLLGVFRWARARGEWHNEEADNVKAVGDLLLKGDAAKAAELIEALQTARAMERAWLHGRPPQDPALVGPMRDAMCRVVALGGGGEWDRLIHADMVPKSPPA